VASRLLTVLVVVLSVALIASLTVWFLDGDEKTASPATDAPSTVSLAELSDFAADQPIPVYWLGERGDDDYELTESSSGRVYVRYLPAGTEAGDERADFVTVGHLPVRRWRRGIA
jgi:hypothetical protein